MKHFVFVSVISLATVIACSVMAEAEEKANLAGDFDAILFPDGWSYLWNSDSKLGESKDYVALEPTPDGSNLLWTPTGLAEIPQAEGGYLWVGALDGTPGHVRAHPGPSLPNERFVIFAYKIKDPGSYSIIDSILVNAAGDASTGLSLRVLVNDTEKLSRATEPGMSKIDFDTELGSLKKGDTVYVAVGAGDSDLCDLFDIQFALESDLR